MKEYQGKYLLGRIPVKQRKQSPITKTMQKMTPITGSSQIIEMGYNELDKKMFVRFKSGPLYQYDEISQEEYDSIINDKDSIGTKLRKVVKEKLYHKVIEEVIAEVKVEAKPIPVNGTPTEVTNNF